MIDGPLLLFLSSRELLFLPIYRLSAMDGYRALCRMYLCFGLICLKSSPSKQWGLSRALMITCQFIWWLAYIGSLAYILTKHSLSKDRWHHSLPIILRIFVITLDLFWFLQIAANHVLYWFKRDQLRQIVDRLREIHRMIEPLDGGTLKGQRYLTYGMIALLIIKLIVYEVAAFVQHPENLSWISMIEEVVYKGNAHIGMLNSVLVVYFSVYFRSLIKRLESCLVAGAPMDFVMEKLGLIEEKFNELGNQLSSMAFINYSYQAYSCISYPYLLFSQNQIYSLDAVIRWTIDKTLEIVTSVVLAHSIERAVGLRGREDLHTRISTE